MSTEPTTRLFVYGTLKRGLCRHAALQGATFLGTARTLPAYRMLNVGTYPGLVDAPGAGRRIHGEVWLVDAAMLRRLDLVEGVDEGLYSRRRIQLADPPDTARENGAMVEAYFYLQSIESCPDCGENWGAP